ncbi:MAG: 3-oxoacyl-ACP synthase [Bacteroidetes bacterium]|nr:3-oxoacyl-ACP synthase [Bacteroidota bacterium]
MLKTELSAHCLRILEEKMAAIQGDLDELIQSIQGESKSSAGDKHETARAMMNIEQEKLGRQLEEVLQMKEVFQRIDFKKHSDLIVPGSLISTDKGIFLLSIALGKSGF